MTTIYYTQYSERSYLITGDTKEIKDKLKELGCKWNSKLKGWIVSKIQFDSTIQTELSKMVKITEKTKETTNTDTNNYLKRDTETKEQLKTPDTVKTPKTSKTQENSDLTNQLNNIVKDKILEKLSGYIDKLQFEDLIELYKTDLSESEYINKIIEIYYSYSYNK